MLLPVLLTSMAISINCGRTDRTVYYVNVDCSNSTSEKFTRDAYRNDFKKILEKAKEGDIIILDRISANSFSTSDPLTVKLPEYSIFGANKDMSEKINDSLKKDFMEKSEKYFDNPEYSETDIINSLSKSISYMRRADVKDFRKIIVLFSDMIQETDELDLTEGNGDEKQIKILMTNLEKQKKIFNLDSIEVYVSGATYFDISGTQINLKQTEFTKKFWQEYFKRCNMKYKEEMYQSRLSEF